MERKRNIKIKEEKKVINIINDVMKNKNKNKIKLKLDGR